MKGNNVVAERYAQALFGVGQKHKLSEQFFGTLELLDRYLQEYTDLQRVLYNPLIRPEAKKELVIQLLPAAPQLFLNFASMVIDNRRERLFPHIRDSFARLYLRSQSRVAARLTTALPLKSETADALQQQLKTYLEQDLQLEQRVDPAIIGGAILQIGDQVYDGSIRGRLNAISQSLN